MASLFWLPTRGVVEILGLVPSNPRRNTSNKTFEVLLSGSKAAPKWLHGATLEPLWSHFGAAFCKQPF
jgi:hypothetical protein